MELTFAETQAILSQYDADTQWRYQETIENGCGLVVAVADHWAEEWVIVESEEVRVIALYNAILHPSDADESYQWGYWETTNNPDGSIQMDLHHVYYSGTRHVWAMWTCVLNSNGTYDMVKEYEFDDKSALISRMFGYTPFRAYIPCTIPMTEAIYQSCINKLVSSQK